jgi:hypothetical protein
MILNKSRTNTGTTKKPFRRSAQAAGTKTASVIIDNVLPDERRAAMTLAMGEAQIAYETEFGELGPREWEEVELVIYHTTFQVVCEFAVVPERD